MSRPGEFQMSVVTLAATRSRTVLTDTGPVSLDVPGWREWTQGPKQTPHTAMGASPSGGKALPTSPTADRGQNVLSLATDNSPLPEAGPGRHWGGVRPLRVRHTHLPHDSRDGGPCCDRRFTSPAGSA